MTTVATSRRIWQWLGIVSCVCCLAIISGRAERATQVPGQSPAETHPQIFRAERNEVEVVVTVRDSKGNPVTNLKESDFEIRDKGKPQSITSFTIRGETKHQTISEPSQPPQSVSAPATTLQRRFVGLFFDDVHTEPGDLARVQEAAERFVQESLAPEDRVKIFKASENGEVNFTNDKPKLLARIADLRAHTANNSTAATQCPRITNYEAYLIVNGLDSEALTMVTMRLLDCMCPPPPRDCRTLDQLENMARGYAEQAWQFQNQASRQLLAALDLTVRVLGTMPGRRILLFSSAGFLSADLERDANRLIDNAVQRGVVIDALSAKGLYAEAPGGNLRERNLEGVRAVTPRVSMYEAQQSFARMETENEAMTDFAESTGGKFFHNNNDFARGLNELAAPEASYSLAFSPHPLKHDGKFHSLKIEIKTTGDHKVYARKGYFAPAGKKDRSKDVSETSQATITSADKTPPTLSEPNASVIAQDPTKPEVGTDASSRAASDTSKTPPLLPQPSTAPAVTSTGSPAAQPASADAAAEIDSKRAFLNRASLEVGHYIETFADLTADETRVMQSFDDHGLPDRQRSMRSALVVYRLRNDPESVIEYRDVISMDRHEVKGHADRSTKLWQAVAEAHSTEEEVKRLNADSERYDIGMAESGLTLFEGLPLRTTCEGDFTFRELRPEVAKGRPVRVFAYQQVHPCNLIVYHFGLPAQFADTPLLHAGELTLDAETAQIVREERNVYLGNPGKKSPRVVHMILGYEKSTFGILVPETIEIETFVPRIDNDMTTAGFRLYARSVQTYSPFSRFEVSVGEKVSEPVH